MKKTLRKEPTGSGVYGSIGDIIAFEQGELDREETVELFQHLIDTGLVWQLQGFYGRTAKDLIDSGECQL